jgi:hypothetical protein
VLPPSRCQQESAMPASHAEPNVAIRAPQRAGRTPAAQPTIRSSTIRSARADNARTRRGAEDTAGADHDPASDAHARTSNATRTRRRPRHPSRLLARRIDRNRLHSGDVHEWWPGGELGSIAAPSAAIAVKRSDPPSGKSGRSSAWPFLPGSTRHSSCSSRTNGTTGFDGGVRVLDFGRTLGQPC